MAEIETRGQKKYYLAGLLSFAVLILLDQATKQLAVLFLQGNGPVPVLGELLELFYLENRGAAFGMMANRQWFFIMVALVIAAAAIYIYAVLPPKAHYNPLRLCVLLVASGGVGNMLDRMFRRFVVDFLYLSWIDFPVFNFADCYVVAGAFLSVILIFTKYRRDDFSFLHPQKNYPEEGEGQG